ncbi:DUF1622 domain-containing protein [Deinococcus radiophilus]|nr:DUF1622 domain-containing protein [Deinococcus radiophilus]
MPNLLDFGEMARGWILEAAHLVATLAELAAVVIVVAALLEGLWRSAKVFMQRDQVPDELKESLRLQLGRWLAIALEFLLAADIMLTAVAPTWEEIGKLAAIATIRTALNFFLQKEIEAHEQRHGRTTHPDHT